MKTFEQLRADLFDKLKEIDGLEQTNILKSIMEWLAWQLADLYSSLENSQARIYESVANQLFPEIAGRALPAHSIVYALPTEVVYELSWEDQFIWNNPTEQEGIYFSPVIGGTLVKGQIISKLTKTGLWISEGNRNWQKSSEIVTTKLNEREVYIGLQMPKEIEDLTSLTFYFDWKEQQKKYAALLPHIQWSIEGRRLLATSGFQFRKNLEQLGFPDEEFFRLAQLQSEIHQHYEHQFITLNVEKELLQTKAHPVEIPLVEKSESSAQEELLWIKLYFPEGFTQEDLDTLEININCFPVWNAKVVIDKDKRADRIMIVPLTNNRVPNEHVSHFLGVSKVWSDKSPFRPVAYENYREADPGTFALHCGNFEEFNASNAISQIQNLMHTMDSYSNAFGVVERELLYANLESMEEPLLQLQQVIDAGNLNNCEPNYYLHIKPNGPKELIYIEFLLTQGALKNEEEFLEDTFLTATNFDCAKLIKAPCGGRAPLTKTEKQNAIKKLIAKKLLSVKPLGREKEIMIV